MLFIFLFALLGGYLLRDTMGPLNKSLGVAPGQITPQPLSIDTAARVHPSENVSSQATLTIASFHITDFDVNKSTNVKVMDLLARVIRNFDVVAIQGVQSRDNTFIPHFLSLVNGDGSQYEFELGPRVGRNTNKQQFAIFFDSQTTEIDRQATYTVADPHDRILHEPLVALFRARTSNSDNAFTFKLVNVYLDPVNASEELATLRDVYSVVLDDSDQEDDVVLLGNFSADTERLIDWGHASGIEPAVQHHSAGSVAAPYTDNLCLLKGATREFNGKTGVTDIVRLFNLTTEEAAIISDHFPVWAEFSVFEGGRPNRFANRPSSRIPSD